MMGWKVSFGREMDGWHKMRLGICLDVQCAGASILYNLEWLEDTKILIDPKHFCRSWLCPRISTSPLEIPSDDG